MLLIFHSHFTPQKLSAGSMYLRRRVGLGEKTSYGDHKVSFKLIFLAERVDGVRQLIKRQQANEKIWSWKIHGLIISHDYDFLLLVSMIVTRSREKKFDMTFHLTFY